jgi:hypothetical protein
LVFLAIASRKAFAPGNRILIHIVRNCLHRNALDVFRRRKIRKALRKIDRPILHRFASHFAND